ncbi:hypothetical protein ES332_D11G056000v1 [Gossypium tomentosum]|uniref:Uncharacterized protein n=1 Tax=Gossypium tomentosum TaxID=34277 RepID=A0A5D2IIM1_GOSTO|nr:hypothetical protein ES332_D11G056000v1 [Gossypium tomentosum]
MWFLVSFLIALKDNAHPLQAPIVLAYIVGSLFKTAVQEWGTKSLSAIQLYPSSALTIANF